MQALIPAQAEVAMCTDDYGILMSFGEVLELLFPILHQTPPLLAATGACMCQDIVETHWPEILQLEQRCLHVFRFTLNHHGPDDLPYIPDESLCWLTQAEQRRLWLVRWISAPGMFEDSVSVLSDITNISRATADDTQSTVNSGYQPDSDNTSSTLSFAFNL